MPIEQHPDSPEKRPVTFGPLVLASLFWTGILASGVAVLAISTILVGAANPFRYVGF